MRISRRKFLFGLTGVCVLPFAATLTWANSSERLVRSVVEKRLGGTTVLDESSLSEFVDEFLRTYADVGSTKWQVLRMLAPVYRYSDVLSVNLSPLSKALWWLEKEIVHEYLLGTDYFYYDQYPPGKPLVYNGQYLPRLQPCRNPFAQFDIDTEAV